MRVTRGKVRKNKHKKVLKANKGYKGGRSKIFCTAMQGMMRALKRAFRDRRKKKRDFRGLWIQRINAATKEHDFSYSRLINGLNKSNIVINRKILAELAVQDKDTFNQILAVAKAA